ncbi:uncharacterized membrane protein YidH (DUF202 family) [Paenibacillus turicensis]|uniref:Uncharacterized membrane protein YidH (DUF202 family) n=1 Tax=Paenibacillus turicensis TaxID=160487 RepID=A0ABS4FPQ7_9BACL|nr:hypothetical protein [Paenibacillus turicensis]MBP1904567.1 uncharacterized membrane protein YidH (DUF202 family) [Paenibacillus turicensis]
MLKLLKYDLKRNLNTFASLFALLIILQGAVTIIGNTRHWDDVIIVFLILMLYALTGAMLGIMSVNTYRKNIKSYSRRLVPKRPIWHVISSLILGLAAEFVLLIIMLVHTLIYLSYVGDLNRVFNSISISFSGGVSIVVQFVLFFTFMYCAIVLSTTIAASIKGKVGVWVGIGSYFVIQIILWKVETMILSVLGFDSDSPFLFIRESEVVGTTSRAVFSINGQLSGSVASVIIEFFFIACMLYATSWLLRHKEQV